MQRIGPSLRGALTAAVCGLLGASAQASDSTPVEFSSAVLFYHEPNRVTATETVVNGSAELAGGRFVRGRFVYDALTGASANGATPASTIQTFTRPSGNGSYQTKAGKTPLDDTFSDQRFAGTLSYDLPLGRLSRLNASANGSGERDYRSFGLSTVLSHDLNLRNTTLTLGLSGTLDQVRPLGGTPDPLTSMRAPTGNGHGGDDKEEGEGEAVVGSESKHLYDLLAGVTQVIDRTTLMQVNYTISRSDGYLTDPYKLISVLHASGAAVGEPVDYLYESRPDRRTKQSLYWEGKHTTGSDVMTVSYRYMWDDWKVRSHTVDAHYRIPVSSQTWVEPQGRWYRQSAASFYRSYLLDTEVAAKRTPMHASADYRLGRMDTLTGGLKLGHTFAGGQEGTLRLEYYEQLGRGHPAPAIGSWSDRDLFPKVDAFIAQVGFSTHW